MTKEKTIKITMTETEAFYTVLAYEAKIKEYATFPEPQATEFAAPFMVLRDQLVEKLEKISKSTEQTTNSSE